MTTISVLSVGIDPALIDFSNPANAVRPRISAQDVLKGIEGTAEKMKTLGYDIDFCLVDFGDSAEQVLLSRLRAKSYDCILFGAGLRLVAANTALFERLLNSACKASPGSKLCFNTKPDDSVEAVRRWFG